MSQLGRTDEAVAVLVKVSQPLNEVIASVSGSPGADCLDVEIVKSTLCKLPRHHYLHNWKKLLEGDSIICSVLNNELLHFALSRILN